MPNIIGHSLFCKSAASGAACLAIAGKNREGPQVLKNAEARIMKPATGDGEITYKFAQARDALGDKGSALHALDRSIEQGVFCYAYMAADSLLKTIRGETECARILEKVRRRQDAFTHNLVAYK